MSKCWLLQEYEGDTAPYLVAVYMDEAAARKESERRNIEKYRNPKGHSYMACFDVDEVDFVPAGEDAT